MVSGPQGWQNWLCHTTSDAFPSQNTPTDSAEEPDFKWLTAISLCTALPVIGRAAAPLSVYPERAEGFTQSLNGDWSFKYIPALDAGGDAGFHAPSFDVSAWRMIRVPANWELQGFAEPHYALE